DVIGDRVAVIGQPLIIGLHATDLNQDTLTFSADGLPAGANVTAGAGYGTARVQWAPTGGTAGDSRGDLPVPGQGRGQPRLAASDQQTIRLVVRAQNRAPVLAPVADQTIAAGQPLVVNLSASDPDGDTIMYTALSLPPGATLDHVSGVLTWTPTALETGRFP